jgi:hypothetical protein
MVLKYLNMKRNFFGIFIIVLACLSCKNTDKGPDLASNISGKYFISKYETELGASNPGTLNLIEVEKVDNSHVKLTVNYVNVADTNAVNVIAPNMLVSQSGSNYELSQLFSNGRASALVDDSSVTLKIQYLNGNFLEAYAKK